MKSEFDNKECQTFIKVEQILDNCGAALRDEVARPNSENTSVFSIALFNGLSGPSKRRTRRWVWLPRPALLFCYHSSTIGPRRRTSSLRFSSPFQRQNVVRDPVQLLKHETDTWPPLPPTKGRAHRGTPASTALCQSAKKGSQCHE